MTKIQWTEDVWNPIAGCSVLSPGCTNCYAMRMAWRLSRNPATPQYHGTVKLVNGKPVWTGVINRASDATLTAPLRRRKPTVWFVNSMSDLFHEDVPDEWIDRVFAVMALCPRHKFQVLTKRAARMRDYFATWPMDGTRPDRITELACEIGHATRGYRGSAGLTERPLPNVWLGVSAEDQRRWDERREHLRDTPAAVRFVSAEPLLSFLDFRNDLSWLDWVIVGGESGPGARPMDLQWPRAIMGQCLAAKSPLFVKQLGANPTDRGRALALTDRKGGDMAEWPADLRIREMPR